MDAENTAFLKVCMLAIGGVYVRQETIVSGVFFTDERYYSKNRLHCPGRMVKQ
jgi:hypothetical protein